MKQQADKPTTDTFNSRAAATGKSFAQLTQEFYRDFADFKSPARGIDNVAAQITFDAAAIKESVDAKLPCKAAHLRAYLFDRAVAQALGDHNDPAFADAYATIRHMQRFNDKTVPLEISKARVEDLIFAPALPGAKDNFTANVIEGTLRTCAIYDCRKLDTAQTFNMARFMAQDHRMSDTQVEITQLLLNEEGDSLSAENKRDLVLRTAKRALETGDNKAAFFGCRLAAQHLDQRRAGGSRFGAEYDALRFKIAQRLHALGEGPLPRPAKGFLALKPKHGYK